MPRSGTGTNVNWKDYCDTRFLEIKESTEKARQSMERRLDTMNEFRQSLRDQSNQFVSRSENDAKLGAISDRLSGIEKTVWMLTGGALVLNLVIQLAIHFLK
jgi:hypothetical protein